MLKNKLLGIDYGTKRCGLSITDSYKNLALGLICINTNELISYLRNIIIKENINIVVIGKSKKINNKIIILKNKLLFFFPKLIIDFIDERYTSKISKYYLNKIKYPKKKMKKEINIMSSILLLQSYLKIKKI